MAIHLDTNVLRALEAPLFPAEARLVHDIPGRLRVVVPALKGDRARAEAVCAELRRVAAARAIEVNPLTGSILIEHAADAEGRASALRALGEAGCVLTAAPLPSRNTPGEYGARAIDRAAAATASAAFDWVVSMAVRGVLGAVV